MANREYEEVQLESLPERVLPFLRGIATNERIRVALWAAGYSDAEQQQGWKLLLAATGYGTPSREDGDAETRRALAELDAWDEPGFQRIHAALGRLHPAQDAFVFEGLAASRGVSAVVGVSRLLNRLEALGQGSEGDRAALATLEQRGLGREVQDHLRRLVAVVQAAKAPVVLDTSGEDQRRAALASLQAWYRDWAETARAVVRARNLRILLGLAKRRQRKEEEEEVEETAVPSVAAGPVVPSGLVQP